MYLYRFICLFVFILEFQKILHIRLLWNSKWSIYLNALQSINCKECCWQLCKNINYDYIFMLQFFIIQFQLTFNVSFSGQEYSLFIYSVYNQVKINTANKYISIYLISFNFKKWWLGLFKIRYLRYIWF